MTPEGELKKRCRQIAVGLKMLFVNVEGKSYNGWPDTECGKWPIGSGMIHVEFKRAGKRPTPQQWRRIREIREAGGQATWVNNVEDWQRAVGLLPFGDTTVRYRQEDEL